MGFGAVVKRGIGCLAELSALRAGVAFDRHDDTNANHHCQHRRATMADEWERNTGNRRKPHDHQEVDHDVEEDCAGKSRRDQLAIPRLALHRDAPSPTHEQEIEPKD